MNDLRGKTAFLTGGANGIGLGIARRFAARGMNVVLADVDAQALETAAGLVGDLGGNVFTIRLDVRDRQAFGQAAERAEERFGPVHVICNNAGVSSGASVVGGSWEDWDWELGVNLFGVLNGVRTFVPRMIAHGEPGHVVNTASMSGLLPGSALGIYSTTKFAVVGLTECLRLELQDTSVGVSVLCPGFVRSRIFESDRRPPGSGEDGVEGRRTKEAVGKLIRRGIDPDDVGERVVSAILRNELYVFTHPEYRGAVLRRGELLLDAFRGEPRSDVATVERFTDQVERLHADSRGPREGEVS